MNKQFYELLKKYKIITPIWEYELMIIDNKLNKESDKDSYLNLFTIYFSLICSGNVCMSLDKAILENKWNYQVNDSHILAKEDDKLSEDDMDLIDKEFELINSISNESYKYLSKLDDIIKKYLNDIFVIKDNYLYLIKYNEARLNIRNSINRLFNVKDFDNKMLFKLEDLYVGSFKLSDEQIESVKKGLKKNLVITGGPGTGKTTSILYLIIYLLSNSLNYNIYLAASSGKAASRMKESIINGLNRINKDFKDKHPDIIDKINGTLKDSDTEIDEFTIHRLLSLDFNTGGFKYNKDKQFSQNSIFVIDEASMIDILLFESLLDAIPKGSRVFILGDKDQLPSVEVGAVFGDLIKYDILKDHVITLNKSNRFDEKSNIFKLKEIINKDEELPFNKNDFKNLKDNLKIEGYKNSDLWDKYKSFDIKKIFEMKISDDENKYLNKLEIEIKSCPVYYYLNDINDLDGNKINQKDNIEYAVKVWAKHFYSKVQEVSTNIDFNNYEYLNYVFSYTEEAKVLCAENKGIRGVKNINALIKKTIIDKNKKPNLSNHYPGEVMMINKNNRILNLYNGDTGILVSIKDKDDDDEIIYFMVKKNNKRIKTDGYKKDEIFKIGSYLFYPLRLITLSEIDLAFAITIHKSQGSDYNNIIVILPISKGHPLLNRQIVYTAITRTKGYTYIISNYERIEEAKKRLITRDTNVN